MSLSQRFVGFAEGGDDAACASLVEMLAFRGEWDECITSAKKFIANPKSVYAGNIFDDMVRVLGCAGHETRQWNSIEEACIAAIKNIQGADYPEWWPVDNAQVAPVILLVDGRIRTIMDRDRCEEVLATLEALVLNALPASRVTNACSGSREACFSSFRQCRTRPP